MTKHSKTREIEKVCQICGAVFVTGASNKIYCTPECRIRHAAHGFDNHDVCWEWAGSINPKTGYGQLSAWEHDSRKLYTAHRLSFSAFVHSIPLGMMVLHKCDNRKCFNPQHLFLGTQLDNMRDCSQKGRFPAIKQKPAMSWQKMFPDQVPRGERHHFFGKHPNVGETHPMAKLTEQDVIEILQSNLRGVVLVKQYGVSGNTISRIKNGLSWSYLSQNTF